MTIITRITSLFKADIHGILDCIEEPRVMLKQSIRNMAEEIEALTRMIAVADDEIKRCSSRSEILIKELDEAQSQVELSFKADNEELARHFIKKKLDLESRFKRLKSSMTAAHNKQEDVEEKRLAYQQKLSEIKSKAEVFAEHQRTEESVSSLDSGTIIVSSCDVEIEFLQQKERWQKSVT
ncbi:MAG: PspA/IM30 family protein [Pseudomonadales bacterium]|nr:PspA/IM30 family protein [Pseudomonadales bacterium]